MLKLKLQYFGHLMQRDLTHWKRPWCWERLKAGGEEDDRGWDGWMASPTQWTWIWVNSWSWWWTGKPGVLQSMGSQSQTWLSNWTELNWSEKSNSSIYIVTKRAESCLFSPFYPQNLIQVFTKSTFNKYLLTEVLQILKIIYVWN